jgi:hypothetical protein
LLNKGFLLLDLFLELLVASHEVEEVAVGGHQVVRELCVLGYFVF